ncbi:MAG TPA: DUF4412 domain-containing protein [Candidatus Acidoferrales bacterium]|nr:DUF4412 domain-containing protein [Candidatus Acidoferrales bacterium]
MRVSSKRALLSVAAVWLLVGSAAAGVRVETEQREPGSKVALGRTVYFLDANRLRLEAQSEEGEDIVIIFRADRSLAWLIDQREGTYVELTPEKIAKLREQIEAQRQQMEKELAKLPPEQRQAIEQMMGGPAGAGAVSYRAAGRDEKVDSFVCTRYEVLQQDERTAEIWAAPLEQLHIQPEEFKTLTDLGRLLEPLGEQGPVGQIKQMSSMEGFPVRSVSYAAGQAIAEQRVVKAERKTFEPGLFELPRGLRKTDPNAQP